MPPQIENQSAVQANAPDNDIGGSRFKWPGIIVVGLAGVLLVIAGYFAWNYVRGVKEARRAERERAERIEANKPAQRPAAPAQPGRGLVGIARDAVLGERRAANPLPTPRSGVVYSGTHRRSEAPRPAQGQATPVADRGSARQEPPTFLGARVQTAEVWRGDPRYFIGQGRKLACMTVEPLKGVEGHHFTARITEDIRGSTGTAIAIPRDSLAYGNITAGPDDETGQMQIAATLTSIQWPVPEGQQPIGIMINSDLAEPLGTIGAEGNVRTHFLRRLGAAGAFAAIDLMTGVGASLLEDAISGARDGGVNVNIGPSLRRGTTSLAREEYQRQARRKPTFDRPSYPCSIFIRNPLDTTTAAQEWERRRR